MGNYRGTAILAQCVSPEYVRHLPRISLAFAVDVVGICRRYLCHLPRILLAIREWKAASYSILTQNTTIIE